MQQKPIALFLVIVMVASAFTALGLATTTSAVAAPTKNADDVTFTVTDEQGNVQQQTHPVKADANVQPVHHAMTQTGKASSNAASQATGPALVGAAPAEQWNKSYGGAGNEIAFSVRQTTDGGYVLAGSTNSSNGSVYLVKTNATGKQQWYHAYGGTGYDDAREVQQTKDGGYILVGTYWTAASGQQLWLVKTNATGVVNDTQKGFSHAYGGLGDERGYSVQQTSDGGYIAVGATSSLGWRHGTEVYLLKVNATGTVQWERTYGGALYERGFCVRQTADGGYIICGVSSSWTSDGNTDAYLIKTDKNGNIMYPGTWEQTYGGANTDVFNQLVITSDGYALVGSTDSLGAGSSDLWLVKVATNGAEQFNKTFGGSHYDVGTSIAKTTGGGYVVTGAFSRFSNNNDYNIGTIKTDAYGNSGPSYPSTWSVLSGVIGLGKDDWGTSVIQTKDGGYAVAGYSTSWGNGFQAVLYKLAPG